MMIALIIFRFIFLSKTILLYLFIFLNFYFYFILLYNTVLVLPYVDMNPPQFYFKHVLKDKELCYIRKNAECEVATVGFVFVRFLILGLSSYSYKTPEKVTLLSSTVK